MIFFSEKTREILVVLSVCIGLTMMAYADQVKVNIVYPINGAAYPVMDPPPGKLLSAYISASFSTTCKGGPHKVTWGFDGLPALGSASYYDQTSIQLVYKLPAGPHEFWVKCDCGENRVKFIIGR
jgi:hypothetical protein